MDEQEAPPSWPFKPLGLLVELSKIPMGVAYALCQVCSTFYSVFTGIHRDLVAHYNYLHNQDRFAAEVAYDLESLDTTED